MGDCFVMSARDQRNRERERERLMGLIVFLVVGGFVSDYYYFILSIQLYFLWNWIDWFPSESKNLCNSNIDLRSKITTAKAKHQRAIDLRLFFSRYGTENLKKSYDQHVRSMAMLRFFYQRNWLIYK